ncbi:hypothetical protein [Phyllobacterium sp. SB3]|uniref:hypothetical protein n=1 Tax=Phyllobacterium sp. SB3 TaxID=3156073 RepID=UPI0032AFA003
MVNLSSVLGGILRGLKLDRGAFILKSVCSKFVIPNVVVHRLEMPDFLAGGRIDCHDRRLIDIIIGLAMPL